MGAAALPGLGNSILDAVTQDTVAALLTPSVRVFCLDKVLHHVQEILRWLRHWVALASRRMTLVRLISANDLAPIFGIHFLELFCEIFR